MLHIWHGMDQIVIDYAIDEWCGRLRTCVSKHWTVWAVVVIITISIELYEWNFHFFYKYDASFNSIWQFYDKFELLNSHIHKDRNLRAEFFWPLLWASCSHVPLWPSSIIWYLPNAGDAPLLWSNLAVCIKYGTAFTYTEFISHSCGWTAGQLNTCNEIKIRYKIKSYYTVNTIIQYN